MIYLIESKAQNAYKIGFSKSINSFKGRFKCLQSGNPENLKIHFLIKGTIQEENLLHVKFRKYWISREWFFNKKEIFNYFKQFKNLNEEVQKALIKSRRPNQGFIYQFDLKGNLIKKYNSIKMCAESLNIGTSSISKCSRKIDEFNKEATSHGFIFSAKEHVSKSIINRIKNNKKINNFAPEQAVKLLELTTK